MDTDEFESRLEGVGRGDVGGEGARAVAQDVVQSEFVCGLGDGNG